MDYITAREAAEKWGVSERRINQYCAEGRIPGAERFGGAWAIPAGAEKPGDPRKQKTQTAPPSAKQAPELFPGFMPLMNTPFCPGCCKETIAAHGSRAEKGHCSGGVPLFQRAGGKGHAGNGSVILPAADGGIASFRLSDFCLCQPVHGTDRPRPQLALGEIRRTLAAGGETRPGGSGPRRHLWRLPAAVLLHLPLPEEMPPCGILSAPAAPGLRAFALYVQAHYLYLKEDYAHSAGMVEGALAMGAAAYPIPAIYLHLVAVMDYMSLKADRTGPGPIC